MFGIGFGVALRTSRPHAAGQASQVYHDPDVFFAASVSASNQVAGALFVDDETFLTAVVGLGGAVLSIEAAPLVDADTFYGAALATTYAIAGGLFAPSSTFYGATVAFGDGGPTPTFEDNFNTLDWSKWNSTFDYEPDGYSTATTTFVPVGNPQGITPWAVTDGVLGITCAPATGLARSYSSGHMDTNGKFSQKYGYFEARIMFPPADTCAGSVGNGDGDGAFWLLPTSGAWPPEIDIVEAESWGWTGTIHNPDGSSSVNWTNIDDIATAFHVYAIDWNASTITWYVDGEQVYQVPNHVNEPMFMLLTNYANASAPAVPGTMKVDYVRVWTSNPN